MMSCQRFEMPLQFRMSAAKDAPFKMLTKLLIILFVLRGIDAWRSFKVVFTQIEFEANKSFMDCKMEIVNTTGETTVNGHLSITEQLDDINFNFSISMENNDGTYTQLVSRSVHLCKFLSNRAIDPVIKVIYEDLSKHGNLPKSCPIKKGILYFHDYRLDEEMLPSYVPEANFRVDFLMSFVNRVQLLKVRLDGKIDKSKGFNNLKMFSMG